jgi:MerR family mercuric resistance operon transcriptional regulator
MKFLTIAGLAKAGNVGVETVRFYQRKGLLNVPESGFHSEGKVRRYGDDDVSRLRFIRSAQAAGFSLEQIAELMHLNATDDRQRAQELAKEQVAVLDRKIMALQASRDALQHLAKACASGTSGPCPILKAFEHR